MKRLTMLGFTSAAALLLLLGAALLAAPALERPPLPATPDLSQLEPIEVARVVDGDTIDVQGQAGPERLRLIGPDAPEVGQPYSGQATAFLQNLLAGEEVYLVRGEGPERDHFGRRLTYVYRAPDGLFVNLELVRQGYARVYRAFPFEHREAFEFWEARAQAAGKGLWRPAIVAPAPAVPAPAAVTPATAAPQTAPAGQEVTVYVTRTGARYHQAGCRSLGKSAIPLSLGEAKRRGYTACGNCHPPQ